MYVRYDILYILENINKSYIIILYCFLKDFESIQYWVLSISNKPVSKKP